ncbi:MAG TPA: T9SS type A sorting domain-containing protein [Flavobacteriaceae bacterium]|nr:T9SS type A sorting domain-containing protein [Flavobacteriaceae bacterium]
MFKKVVIFVLMLSSLSVFSQDTNYTRAFGSYFNHNKIIAIALDDEHNVWVLSEVRYYQAQDSYFNSVITSDAYQSDYGGGEQDLALSKFSSEGTLVYASYFGGQGYEKAGGISIKNDKVFINGTTTSSGLATPGAYQETLNPFTNYEFATFIAEFDLNGQLQWSTYFQGNRSSDILNIEAGNDNDLYVYGETRSDDLGTDGVFKQNIPPPYYNDDGVEYAPNYPILARFDDSGQLIWATYYGPDILSSDDGAISSVYSGLGVDSQNNVYINGRTSSTHQDYFGTSGTHQSSHGGGLNDMFVAKFSSSGQRLWGSYFGGEGEEVMEQLQVLRGDQIYITGVTTSQTNIATDDAWKTDLTTGNSSFVARMNPNGTLIWSTYLSPAMPSTLSVGTDSAANVYLYTSVPENPDIITNDSYQNSFSGGASDMALLKFDFSGSQLLWGSYYGGSGIEVGSWTKSMIIFNENTIYAVGRTTSENNIVSPGAFQEIYHSVGQLEPSFLVKFVACPEVDSPTGESIQYFEEGDALQDLEVSFMNWSGSDIITTWYADSEGTVPIQTDTELEDGETYYVSQKIQGCEESELLAITVYKNMNVSLYSFKNVQLYPNPNKGDFTLKGLEVKPELLTLYDLHGRQVYSEESVPAKSDYQFRLNGQLSSGLYFLKIQLPNASKTFKVMVK